MILMKETWKTCGHQIAMASNLIAMASNLIPNLGLRYLSVATCGCLVALDGCHRLGLEGVLFSQVAMAQVRAHHLQVC